MKSPVKHYLSISKKEWNGMVVLIVLISIVLAAPYVYQSFRKDKLINFKEFNADVALLNKSIATSSRTSVNTGAGAFKKSYHFTDSVSTHYYLNKIKPGEAVELNSADSARLTTIHGVGPVFARRIIKYRERLGGFHHKEQLKEVFGVDAEKYNQISTQVTVNVARVSHINVNTATFEQLKRFPYLSFKQMNAVIQYRNQHGKYTSVKDMQGIAILNKETLNKIEPYLEF